MGRLAGKRALITGAASGIGSAVAELFRSEGAYLIAADIQPNKEPASKDFLPLRHDVAKEDDWISAVRIAEQAFGGLDILVNSAGVGSDRPRPLVEVPLAEWRRIMSVNLDGTFLGLKHAIPAIRRTGGGAVVNLSSVLGLVATENAAAYCSSKAGVHLLTKAAALEAAADEPLVRVNCVNPGFVDTPMVRTRLDPEGRREAQLHAATPLKRLATAAEVAATILFLAADDSSYMTGASLSVDGGYSAR